jgi:hypothetical protein
MNCAVPSSNLLAQRVVYHAALTRLACSAVKSNLAVLARRAMQIVNTPESLAKIMA